MRYLSVTSHLLKSEPAMPSPHELGFFTPGGFRGKGIVEQLKRCKWFLSLAVKSDDAEAKHRLLFAGLYAGRAAIEIMLEGALKQELPAFRDTDDSNKSRKDFENAVKGDIPHYALIEKIRIHDFHRFGCLPPVSNVEFQFMGGPMQLIARNGGVQRPC